MDIGVAEYATNNIYCNLTLIGADFEISAFGIVIPKDWIYAQDLDVNILSLRELGNLDDIRKKWFQAKTCPDSSDGPNAMGIESLGGLILTFGVICILALLVFIWKNRYMIKNYVFTLFRRKNAPTHHVPTVKNAMKTSNNSPNIPSHSYPLEQS